MICSTSFFLQAPQTECYSKDAHPYIWMEHHRRREWGEQPTDTASVTGSILRLPFFPFFPLFPMPDAGFGLPPPNNGEDLPHSPPPLAFPCCPRWRLDETGARYRRPAGREAGRVGVVEELPRADIWVAARVLYIGDLLVCPDHPQQHPPPPLRLLGKSIKNPWRGA